MMYILFIVFGIIAFPVIVFWIWKYKNWSNTKKAALIIILAAGLSVAMCVSFGLLVNFPDLSGYYGTRSNLGEIDYDKMISNAKKAGYKVDEFNCTIGVHPINIKELDERFGEDYRFRLVAYYYRENVSFYAKHSEGGTDISFYNGDRPDALAPFKPEDLPPDEWIVEKFMLMFNITEQESRDYLTQLKDSIGNSQEELGKISIRKGLDIATVYSILKETSTNSNVSSSGGTWIEETFYSQDKKIGVLELIISDTRVILQDNGHKYMIEIDMLGGVDMNIRTKEEIPEEEYRRIFKDMFVNLGLPAEKVDEFEFKYKPQKYM